LLAEAYGKPTTHLEQSGVVLVVHHPLHALRGAPAADVTLEASDVLELAENRDID
jgi:hypothetical protein